MTTKQVIAQPAIHVRWMIRRDMDEVLDIERQCFPQPWTDQDFLEKLRQRNCIGMVANFGAINANGFLDSTDDGVLGFMIYELEKRHLRLVNFAVHPRHQWKFVGRTMMNKLKSKLHPYGRQRIESEVRERNLPFQLFLRAEGFVCTETIREQYEDTSEDGYFFRFVGDC